MFTLRLLGGAALEDAGRPLSGRVVQQRRLGLLALLAVAPGRALSRDTLIALLWPDAGTRSGRHRLAAALYDLRSVLGHDAVVSRGDQLWLDPVQVRADAGEFEEALAAREWERAVSLYPGPFLAGFYVSGAAELERWIEETRDRLARGFARALEMAAQERAARGDATGAADAWYRLAAVQPYDPRIAVRVMEVLAAAGDRAGALLHAATYGACLRRDLDAEPDAAVRRTADRLRVELAEGDPGGRGSSGSVGGAGLAPLASEVAASEDPPHDATLAAPTPRRRSPALRAPPALLASLAAVILLLLTAALALRRSEAPASPEQGALVVVLPFAVQGGEDHHYLGEGIVELLSLNLEGAGGLRVMDPHAVLALHARNGVQAPDAESARLLARRFGAQLYVVGSVFADAQRLRVHAELRSPDAARPLARATVDAAPDHVLALVDEVTGRLVAGMLSAPHQRIPGIAARTTHSVVALRDYLHGERDFRAGRFVPAAEAFERAVAEDSTFALAHYRLALAIIWADRYGASPEAAERAALRHSGRLAERDRVLLQAYSAWRSGDAVEAERLYRRTVAAYPDDVEAWFQLGETLFHYNPSRGRPIAEAREAFERVLAYDAAHWGALWHLAQLAAYERRGSEFDQLTERLLELQPDSAQALEVRAFHAFARGDQAARERTFRDLRGMEPLRLFTIGWRTAVFAHRIEDAARVFELLTAPGQPPREQGMGLLGLAHLELARGRPRAALAGLPALEAPAELGARTRAPVGVRWVHEVEVRAHLAAFPFLSLPRVEREAVRGHMVAWAASTAEASTYVRADRAVLAPYLGGLISVAVGDTTDAAARAGELERLATEPRSLQAAYLRHALRAQVERRNGDLVAALTELDRAELAQWYGHRIAAAATSGHHERWLRAEILFELGRYHEALGWYASLGEHSIFDLTYLGPSYFRRGEIHERLGNARQAAQHYRRFIELWRDCEPDFRPTVEEAQRRLQRLVLARSE